MATASEIKSEVISTFQNEEDYLLLSEKVLQFASGYSLTKREIELLTLSIAGYSNKLIAIKCCISEKTVKHHLENIKGKIAVHSSRKLMALFIESLIKPLHKDA
jgi:DNA-binding CsgD family transcriptional regulator